MAESTLSLSRTDLLNAVSFFLGFGVSYSSITDSGKQTLVQRCVDSGLRSFYAPMPLPGERISHIFSFMQPTLDVTIDANQSAVDLPDDFGGVVGSVYLSPEDSGWNKIKLTGIGQILSLRQTGLTDATGIPQFVATRPLGSDGTDGQRFFLEVYPTTNAPYVFRFSYYSNPYQLTADKPYPVGGQPHAETIREAVLSAAEREVWNESGIHTLNFKERMVASVNLDRRLTGPKTFGMNSDGSDLVIANHRFAPFIGRSGYVSYNGSIGE